MFDLDRPESGIFVERLEQQATTQNDDIEALDDLCTQLLLCSGQSAFGGDGILGSSHRRPQAQRQQKRES